MRGSLRRMRPIVHPHRTILFVRADIHPDVLQVLRLIISLFPNSQVERSAHDVGSNVHLALMLRHSNARRAPRESDSTSGFGDRNTKEVRYCRVADTFLVWLRRPCAAQIDTRLPIERARKLGH